ncbi:excinuclease ABC subunit B [Candidatus Marsarchaeota G1 archaeon OSP_D]|jgi:excinuclease ABC subunit B|uniref:UvrABC system protein B n=6 Tax=Candidatus Marsarchaeota TaxID=1978152 RepID=A0A2R6AG61_9ARCH|nr:MAG: excinuclease ABC subunit B [Candidatus Marsarchaeota G1 archaeon OSP_D]PSN85362.1 MAG: excinuclease ABC subunit B [Candidatus Marsarchaeota G1 archaeon BE_D]PSN89452.1 MAG: excinuclease ABC subunit B [Candidatus Marsarchaeota G1 archaeon OSP_C]
MLFEISSEYKPAGDQPQAIERLVEGLNRGYRFQTLLGATGTGKTLTIAHVIARVQRPTLVISHNKTLAAQLAAEFRALFPKNAVEYFVSYYDYYQPEAYVPQIDLYIEKEAEINEEIDRLRHRATQALLTRRDVIIVASVSCIYNLGSPLDYKEFTFELNLGQKIVREELFKELIELKYERNQLELGKGKFRARGGTIEIGTADDTYIRVELDEEDRISSISSFDLKSRRFKEELSRVLVFPATHFLTPREKIEKALRSIEKELEERLKELRAQGKLLEAQRLETRTRYDMEMIREVGYCTGIENYSRHFTGRAPGEPPYTLLDFFPKDFLTVIDESHVTVPQLRGMYEGDRSRKQALVEYGFRLPSAFDNRPLKFEEFLERVGQVIFMSATPGPFELEVSSQVVEQIIRPTGLVDPEVVIKPARNQVDDLLEELRRVVERGERALVTTLTKRSAEDLADYLLSRGFKVHYLHSELESLERVKVLRDLRKGKYDVVVGVNLLREGLDLPEVSLVAILDADKEGFLRSQTSLIQTIGRAARNVNGRVILYADNVTDSIKAAVDETNRRRKIQIEYNKKHGITPKSVRKDIRSIVQEEEAEVQTQEKDLNTLIAELEEQMLDAARKLEFEKAAQLRDKIRELKKVAGKS